MGKLNNHRLRNGIFLTIIIFSLLSFGITNVNESFNQNLIENYEESFKPFKSEEIEPIETIMTIDETFDLPGDQNLVIENNRMALRTIEYSDNLTYPIHLEDAVGAPLVSVPVWFQVGLVPELLELDFLTENYPGAFFTGNYLYTAPDIVHFSELQDPLGRPLTYPFQYYDQNTGTNEWESWAPLQFECEMTDANGNANFTFDGGLAYRIERYVGDRLSNMFLEQIILYVRIFYNSSFDSAEMQLPEGESYFSPYPVNYDGSSPDIYNFEANSLDFGGSVIYSEPLHLGTHVHSFIQFVREDTMLISSPHIVNDPSSFYASTQIVEADMVDGSFVPEPTRRNNFLSTFGISHHDFMIDLECFNMTGGISLIPVLTTDCDTEGFAKYKISSSSAGESIANFLPGFYSMNFTPNDSSLTHLYNLPSWHNESLKIRDPLQEVLDRGTLIVGIDATHPPFVMYDAEIGEFIGFDIDIIKFIASHLGINVEFINVSWSDLFSGLIDGDYDCIISAIEITYALSDIADFSRWYYRNETVDNIRIACQEDASTLIGGIDSVMDILLGSDPYDPEISDEYNDIHNIWFGVDALGYINNDPDDGAGDDETTGDDDHIDDLQGDDQGESVSMISGYPMVSFFGAALIIFWQLGKNKISRRER
ncbi:MAG: transporter substrate-binding domain-containing protein [Promethearchaeota archaeon]